ncbi:MAG TPA: hypothetical protein GX515_01650 [Firmicutes bacterium]|nr:hypothetical protein [Bacillota bacterium]
MAAPITRGCQRSLGCQRHPFSLCRPFRPLLGLRSTLASM